MFDTGNHKWIDKIHSFLTSNTWRQTVNFDLTEVYISPCEINHEFPKRKVQLRFVRLTCLLLVSVFLFQKRRLVFLRLPSSHWNIDETSSFNPFIYSSSIPTQLLYFFLLPPPSLPGTSGQTSSFRSILNGKSLPTALLLFSISESFWVRLISMMLLVFDHRLWNDFPENGFDQKFAERLNFFTWIASEFCRKIATLCPTRSRKACFQFSDSSNSENLRRGWIYVVFLKKKSKENVFLTWLDWMDDHMMWNTLQTLKFMSAIFSESWRIFDVSGRIKNQKAESSVLSRFALP